MASKQGAILAAVPSEKGRDTAGQAPEAAPRLESVQQVGAGRASVSAARNDGVTWFQGMLLRRRCDSCGTRINIQGEGDGRVFMRCPECLREYVFFQRPE